MEALILPTGRIQSYRPLDRNTRLYLHSPTFPLGPSSLPDSETQGKDMGGELKEPLSPPGMNLRLWYHKNVSEAEY